MEKLLHEILPVDLEYRMETEAAMISLLLDVNHYNCLSHIYINQNEQLKIPMSCKEEYVVKMMYTFREMSVLVPPKICEHYA